VSSQPVTLQEVLQIMNSGLLLTILVGLIGFHRDWSEIRLMVRTLWAERESREDARIRSLATTRDSNTN